MTTSLSIIFVLGYLAMIALEHPLRLHKTVSALKVVEEVFLASAANLLIPLVTVSIWMRREAPGNKGGSSKEKRGGNDSNATTAATSHAAAPVSHFEQRLFFCFGVGALLFVPIFKAITNLPPWMGILFGLSTLWGVTEILHRKKTESHSGQLGVTQALRRIDISSVLFFLGILLAVGSLQAIGLLAALAGWLEREVGNMTLIVILIGLLSAIVDNVPLVAASMGMYPIDLYPMVHFIWPFMAFCAGTGGSILVIGSAAGVAAMGMEKITFGWYLQKIAPLALAGYLAGAGTYLLQWYLLNG